MPIICRRCGTPMVKDERSGEPTCKEHGFQELWDRMGEAAAKVLAEYNTKLKKDDATPLEKPSNADWKKVVEK